MLMYLAAQPDGPITLTFNRIEKLFHDRFAPSTKLAGLYPVGIRCALVTSHICYPHG